MRRLTLTTASVLSIVLAVCGLLTPRSRSQEVTPATSATGFHTTASNLINRIRQSSSGTPEFYKLVDRLVQEGRQGILALSGEMLLSIDGKTVLIKAPGKK